MLDPDLLVLLIGHLSCGHTSGLHMTNVHATSDKKLHLHLFLAHQTDATPRHPTAARPILEKSERYEISSRSSHH